MPDDPKPAIAIVDKTLIKPIELDDSQGRWVFEPLPDITALEAVLINHMFTAIVLRWAKGDQSRFDWREYLTRERQLPILTGKHDAFPDLARHFRPLE